jgi:putative ABC transport system substrate-binding protein
VGPEKGSLIQAQPATVPVIGILNGGSAISQANRVAAFGAGLKQSGFVEGRNVAMEFRWGEGRYDRLPALAADLVQRRVAVIVTIGDTSSAQAAKAVTTTIPIVIATGSHPVKNGLVASLGRPGGNVTGVTFFNSALQPRRLEMLREIAPGTTVIAMLVNPLNPNTDSDRLAETG